MKWNFAESAGASLVLLPSVILMAIPSFGLAADTPVTGTIIVGANHSLVSTEFLTDRNVYFNFPDIYNASAAISFVGNVSQAGFATKTASSPNPAIHDYTFMGDYTTPVNAKHVTVAFTPAVAVGLSGLNNPALTAKDWNATFNLSGGFTSTTVNAFGQFIPAGTDLSEDTIYDALTDPITFNPNEAKLLQFFAYADTQTYTDSNGTVLGTGLVPIGSSAGFLVDYSNATIEVGGSTVAAVPEPLSMALLPAASILFLCRRRA